MPLPGEPQIESPKWIWKYLKWHLF
jgi:hypothetical protein